MKFTLIITTNHLNNNYSALQFAQAALLQQHNINCIYFLFDGAYAANSHIDMPTDEFAVSSLWSKFAANNNITLSVCAASGLRRGIDSANLASGFAMGSIGQLVASCAEADRVIRL